MKEDINKALAVTKIGEHAVTCYIPNRDKYKCGVFGPISPEANLEEMIKDMKDKNKIEIVKLERLNKRINNNMELSQSVKIILEEIHYLVRSNLGSYFTYPIRPYVYTPTQCFRCQRLWHTAASCKGRERCFKCSGSHKTNNCTPQEEKCANCSGPHRANFKHCTIIKDAFEIECHHATGCTFQKPRIELLSKYVSKEQTQQQRCRCKPRM